MVNWFIYNILCVAYTLLTFINVLYLFLWALSLSKNVIDWLNYCDLLCVIRHRPEPWYFSMAWYIHQCDIFWPPFGRGRTVVSIVSCRCTYCCPETSRRKITRHYSRYCTVAFCYVHKCELSYMCPGHDIILHPHPVKLYRIGCVGSDLVLAKALTW